MSANSKPPSASLLAQAIAATNDDANNQRPQSWNEFNAGLTAAIINTTALYPINKLIFRQMAGGYGTQYAADQMKREGFRYLYRGILPPLIQKMCTVSIMFSSFNEYKKYFDLNYPKSPLFFNLTIAACLTGSTEAIFTPLERVQMLLQDRRYHKDYKHTIDALIKLRTYGFKEYYRGLTCVLTRNCPSNVLFFGFRNKLKDYIAQKLGKDQQQLESSASSTTNLSQSAMQLESASNQNNKSPSFSGNAAVAMNTRPTPKFFNSIIFQNFLSGAILGMVISTLFYPLSVVRTRMQTRAPGTEFLSIVKAFNAVYSERDRKISRLFHGCFINVVRQFVSWGVTNCGYEFILDLLNDEE